MKPVLYLLLFTLSVPAFAQKTIADKPDYPQDYFRNPLDIPIFLAGNFGECRPGHFHSGVDIKTLGAENQPVHAAADGYISRIKMDKGGFGHALYITHANGYTTLYAHLNKFAPAIQQYLEKEQYAKKHWDVDVQLSPEQFPVKKGQQIAWSGNTGASTAPHLHFEIRDSKTEHPLNPELFGLPLVDKIPPLPAEVVIYGFNHDSPIYSGFYGCTVLSILVEKKGTDYRFVRTDGITEIGYYVGKDTLIVPTNSIGIGMNVDDHMDGSDNTIAFYTAKLYMDDSLQAQVTLDDIGYEETRYINAYADYKTKQQQNKWVQCLFQLPGNHLDHIYSHLNSEKGLLSLHYNGQAHKAEISITDDKGNQSNIVFFVRMEQKGPAPQYSGDNHPKFTVNEINHYNDSDISFTLDSRALYDNIWFRHSATKYPGGYSDKYQLHYAYVPVHTYFDLKIRPTKSISEDLKSKVVMMYSDDKDTDGRAAVQADNGWYQAKVRNFGTYWLDIDTIPPVIKSLQKNNSNLSKAKQITFEIKDAMTSVRSFSGYLDGKWICFEQHNDLFFYNFDVHCPKGKHELVFKAEDENGNAQTIHLNFTR